MATLAAVDKRVVEERLTYRESVVTGHTAVLKVATRFNAFVSALAAASAAGSGAGAEVVAAHDALAKELMLMRLEVGVGCLGCGDGSRTGWGLLCLGAGRAEPLWPRLD